MTTLLGSRIVLIVAGGIAAFKALELVRLLRRSGAQIRAVLTEAGRHFVTPLSLQTLTELPVFGDLWSLTDEHEMGHIQLARWADLVVVAPATADLMARMATGQANDLATALLLATDRRVLLAPAMNVKMWQHPATRANVSVLADRGCAFIGPVEGEMACNEFGPGRMAEPTDIHDAVRAHLCRLPDLSGLSAIVTSGPTQEPLDPVRYLGNRSSGKQGHAVAATLAMAGADVTLVHGPVAISAPPGVRVIPVQTAQQMFDAALDLLPVSLFIAAAAVADWRPAVVSAHKIKKTGDAPSQVVTLEQTADIVAAVAGHVSKRPSLVVAFAAETEQLEKHARAKLASKKCDWIVANLVGPETDTLGGDTNQVSLITESGTDPWPKLSKRDVAIRLIEQLGRHFGREMLHDPP